MSVYEEVDVKKLKEILEQFGWNNGEKYGLTRRIFLTNYIYDEIFEQKFYELNKNNLDDLTESERNEVIEYVKNILKNSSEDKLLHYLKNGVEYTVKEKEKRTYRLIDFDNVKNNDFTYGNEIKFPGSPDNIIPDFTLFVNGIPLVIIEVKRSTELESEEKAVVQIRRYEEESPDLFRFVQFGIAYGNNKLFLPTYPNPRKELRVTPALPWKVENPKSLKSEKIEAIEQLLQPEVLLNLIRWFTFFREKGGRKDKIIARYNQYIATEKAIKRIDDYLNGKSQLNKGLIWHWQGSGKTYTMFYIANKFFEKYYDRSPIVFFIVDRLDLQRQLEDALNELKATKFKNYLKTIENIEQLKDVIRTIKRSEYNNNIIPIGVYIVLIQKFQRKDFEDLLLELGKETLERLKETNPEEYEKIRKEIESSSINNMNEKLIELGGIKKKEILLLIDEAHRTQYGLLASVMKSVFKNAIRFGFTGTPVFESERNTFNEFAYPDRDEYYLDVYFIEDSIKDGFTVPIVYDVIQEGSSTSGGIRILLSPEELKKYIDIVRKMIQAGVSEEEIENIVETGQIEETLEENAQESQDAIATRKELQRYLKDVRLFLANEKRIKKLAEYIAQRIEKDTENFKFKAMIVMVDRRSCVIMKKYLDEELQKRYGKEYGEEVKDWTEVVMTYQQNDKEEILEYKDELMKRRGKNDVNEINEDIQNEFKDKENPKILIVTDMLITGFDAPKLKVMYLDKPLHGHRLLQAIARVNRPYKDGIIEKKFGLVVDSVGLLNEIRETLKTFQLIADKKIEKDLEENALGRIEDRFDQFKNDLENIKILLKNLKVNGKDLSIDIDKLKEELETSESKVLDTINKEIEPKLELIAGLWSYHEISYLLDRIKMVIEQFKALGSYENKFIYADEISILSYIYAKVLYYIKGKRVPKEFWDILLKIIRKKTLVEDFEKLISIEINNEFLIKNIENLEKKISTSELQDQDVLSTYRSLKSLLDVDLKNPLYKAIYEKIERARENWVSRNIDTISFAKIVLEAGNEKLSYDKQIEGKSITERIIDTINRLSKEKLGNEKPLQLDELRKLIPKVLNAPKITESHKKDIKLALMKDLFKELKGADLHKKEEFAEEVSKYIMEELKKQKLSGK